MAELSTLSEPIKTAFYAANHPFGRPAESFGVVADAFDETSFTDNAAAIQAALDWSAASGKTVLFGGGIYGFSGTLVLKSNTSVTGIGAHNTKFLQLDTSWPDCLATEAGNGGAAIKLSGFSIDGGWDKKQSFGTGSNWDYASSAMTQTGLHLMSSEDFQTNAANNRDGLGDAYNHVDDILIQNIAGSGLITEGRGEMRIRGLDIRSCANWGAELNAFDCWTDSATISVCGRGGAWVGRGNQRVSNTKLWFTGMNTQEEYGVGFEIDTGVTDIIGTNVSTQDTWGSAFKVQGRGNTIQGNAETTGCLFNRWGYGPSSRTSPIYVVELHGAQDTRTELSVSDRFSSGGGAGLPRLAGLFTSGPTNNRITFNINESHASVTAPYDTTTPVYVDFGAINAKRYNQIETHTGRLLLGQVTDAELGDAAHGVNSPSCKSSGTQRWDATNERPVWAIGGATTDAWVDASGSVLIIPA